MRIGNRVIFILCLCIFVVSSARGQSNNATISGSVVDPVGAAVPDATVTAENTRTGVVTTMTTTGAGVYQLTPIKGACLTHCRSPLSFLMIHWRDGNAGALQMGVRHGAYCLGCCWALMGVLFVVGLMNLVWVAALTAFVLVEKIGPAGARAARVAGAMMIVLGLLVVAGVT